MHAFLRSWGRVRALLVVDPTIPPTRSSMEFASQRVPEVTRLPWVGLCWEMLTWRLYIALAVARE